MAAGAPVGLTLISRDGCDLCDEMQQELASCASRLALPAVEVVDVDADPDRRRRFGHRVPVLLLGADLVCEGRLDEAELRRLLRPR